MNPPPKNSEKKIRNLKTDQLSLFLDSANFKIKLTEKKLKTKKPCCVLAVIQTTNFTGGIKKLTPTTHYDVKKRKRKPG